MKELKVKLTFTDELLGTCSSNEETQDEFITAKAADEETRLAELEAVNRAVEENTDEEEAKGPTKTVFPRDEQGRPIMYGYQMKGFFKESCSMLNRCAAKDPKTGKKAIVNESSKLKAFKKTIDGLIFVESSDVTGQKFFPIIFEGEMGECNRPLRAQTMQGERVALASSEAIPAGATVKFSIFMASDDLEPAVREWLDYGRWHGMLQWRNSGKGSFLWEEVA